MEQKTAEEYLKEKGIHPTEPIYWDLANKTISLNELLDEYAKQQQEIAVEKALEMASEKAKI